MPTEVSENPKQHPTGNALKDPDNWVTGDEPMTGAQASYLQTLSEEAHEEFDPNLSKADASRTSCRIGPGAASSHVFDRRSAGPTQGCSSDRLTPLRHGPSVVTSSGRGIAKSVLLPGRRPTMRCRLGPTQRCNSMLHQRTPAGIYRRTLEDLPPHCECRFPIT
jgi:hypothetical protein